MKLTFIGEDDGLPVGVSHRKSNAFARGVWGCGMDWVLRRGDAPTRGSRSCGHHNQKTSMASVTNDDCIVHAMDERRWMRILPGTPPARLGAHAWSRRGPRHEQGINRTVPL